MYITYYGKHDYGNIGALSYMFKNLESIESWHLDVQDHKANRVISQLGQGLLGATCFLALIAFT